MADVLQVEKREQMGSRATRRLRQSGRVPAVLYGHGQQTESLSIPTDQVKMLLRHKARTVTLSGASQETAMIRDMQWDPLGIDVLHLDLMRVNLLEKVDVTITTHLHGEAVGVREGGVLIELLHEVDIRCPAGSIPDTLTVQVTDLKLGDTFFASDLELPEGVELLTPGDSQLVRVEEIREQEPEEESDGEIAEPEMIGKGGEQDEEGEA